MNESHVAQKKIFFRAGTFKIREVSVDGSREVEIMESGTDFELYTGLIVEHCGGN